MKKLFLILSLTIAIGAFLTIQAVAAEQAQSQKGQMQNAERISQLIDKNVKTSQGQDLGDVKDVIVDRQGRSIYLVLSGDKLGKEKQYIPIPWKAASPQLQDKTVIINMTQQQLKGAPGFSEDNWAQFSQIEPQVNSYYGEAGAAGKMKEGASGMREELPAK
jgi:sporulation protein YlmC with PRC-barrel domain